MKTWKEILNGFLLKKGYVSKQSFDDLKTVLDDIKQHVDSLKKTEGDLRKVFLAGDELLKVERIIKKWLRDQN